MKLPSNDLFSLSFRNGVFPSVLKIAKVVPAFKKDSKIDYSASALSIITHKLTKYGKGSRQHPNNVVRVPVAQLTFHSLNAPLPPPS